MTVALLKRKPMTVERAMVLSAGLGERMRPLTNERPKPLLEVRGETLLDRALDHLASADVHTAVVNTHYLAEMIAGHLASRRRPRIELSHEPDLLETGGGVVKALSKLGRRPFFVINSDSLWLDGPQSALRRLMDVWDGPRMDALLLVYPTVNVAGYGGSGDFLMAPDGALNRRREGEIAPFLFTGVQLLHPRLFADAPDGPFSLNLLYDAAENRGRLFGMRHDGLWFHVGTPELLARAEAEFPPARGVADVWGI